MKKVILYSSNKLKSGPQTGGVKRFQELVRYLGSKCNVTLMSGDDTYEVPANVRYISMEQHKKSNNELGYALMNRKYLRAIKKEKYDWFIVFDVPPAIWLVLFHMPHICLMVRKDLLGYEKIILDGKRVGRIKRFLKFKSLLIAEIVTMLFSEKIIVQCEYDKKEILKRHKILGVKIENKIKVQINNVNPSWAGISSADKAEDNIVFQVGSVNGFSDLRKGCDLFLGAVAKLIDEGNMIEAFIAGNGFLLDTYKNQYKSYPMIHFSGRVSNPVQYIKRMDMVIVPSRADSCPNTVMEAMYNGVPVIASNVGGIPEILKDQSALFDPSIKSLSNLILKYTSVLERNRLLERQTKRKEELSFDWVEKVYQIIIGDCES